VKEELSDVGNREVNIAVTGCGSPVVVKKIRKDIDTPKKLITNEVKAGQMLIHPNIIKFREHFEDKDNYYIVLDYIHGKDLLSFMEDRDFQPLMETVARSIFLQLLDAVEYCHERGVSHKDLKLENVMIDKQARVSLIDFGLCEFLGKESKRISKSYVGTPEYVAPEILQLIPFDPYKADVFTLGEILWCLLTGTLPFDLEYRVELLRNGIKPAPNFDIVTNLSESTKDLLENMLEADPDLRFSVKDVRKHPWAKKRSFSRESPTKPHQHNHKHGHGHDHAHKHGHDHSHQHTSPVF